MNDSENSCFVDGVEYVLVDTTSNEFSCNLCAADDDYGLCKKLDNCLANIGETDRHWIKKDDKANNH